VFNQAESCKMSARPVYTPVRWDNGFRTISRAPSAARSAGVADEFHVDQRQLGARLRDTAEASGRAVDEMPTRSVNVLGAMSADEHQPLMKVKVHYPRDGGQEAEKGARDADRPLRSYARPERCFRPGPFRRAAARKFGPYCVIIYR
jgi:hypothetical protein